MSEKYSENEFMSDPEYRDATDAVKSKMRDKYFAARAAAVDAERDQHYKDNPTKPQDIKAAIEVNERNAQAAADKIAARKLTVSKIGGKKMRKSSNRKSKSVKKMRKSSKRKSIRRK